ncbi:hypothetical protein CLCR_01856 [Cladophialophora carrionii]|uniref:C2H2-type domain-containing protein n=1 Tax=Cladophialophora carrionii TaxID=86049 RepID=A0A1C1CDQ5_9EURO|nr:hypothetical protein CLCR_01856 [Cladophialophora carrionii]
MTRRRSKAVIEPCRYCGQLFRRLEHLYRHERTRMAVTGGKFGDLLSRHNKLSHTTAQEAATPNAGATKQQTTAGNATADMDLCWDPELLMQDILPIALFDSTILNDAAPSTQPVPSKTFPTLTSHLPSMDGIEHSPEANDILEAWAVESEVPWSVSGAAHEKLQLEVQAYSEVLDDGYEISSRKTLARNMEAYFRCNQELLPFIHPATFSAGRQDVELVLAVAALGALHRLEHSEASELYSVARAILLEKLRRENPPFLSYLLTEESDHDLESRDDLGNLQTFILLIQFVSWANQDILPEAFVMSSQLACLIRQNSPTQSDQVPLDAEWSSWVAHEERRRTLYAAYTLSNIHSIAFNRPPLIRNHEVYLFLPSDAERWKSTTASQWCRSRRSVDQGFQEVFRNLLDGKETSTDAPLSSVALYVLIHGILQEILLMRQQWPGPMLPQTMKSFENALCAWQRSWELTRDSTRGPLSSNGPLGLTATALLRLAYIRLNANYSLDQGLVSEDLRNIITGPQLSLTHSLSLHRAVLHATHALSMSVRLSLELTARITSPFRSIEQSLCGLECALLLKDWLELIAMAVASSGVEGVRRIEKSVLQIIHGIIQETPLAKKPNIFEDDASQIRAMARDVIKLWANIFEGAQLGFDKAITAGLQLLASDP